MDILDLAEKVREARRDKGFSQSDVARLSGVNRVTINRFENGRVNDMTFSSVVSIMEAVGLGLRVSNAARLRPTFDDLRDENEEEDNAPGLG